MVYDGSWDPSIRTLTLLGRFFTVDTRKVFQRRLRVGLDGARTFLPVGRANFAVLFLLNC